MYRICSIHLTAKALVYQVPDNILQLESVHTNLSVLHYANSGALVTIVTGP